MKAFILAVVVVVVSCVLSISTAFVQHDLYTTAFVHHPSLLTSNWMMGCMPSIYFHCKHYEHHPSQLQLSPLPYPNEENKIDDVGNVLSGHIIYDEENAPTQYIGKTVESFKLADLYWLEACVIMAADSDNIVDRLAFHRPTASYLLGYNITDDDSTNALPFRPCRFQYLAKVIALGQTPHELLSNIDRMPIEGEDKSWILDYDTFEPLRNDMHPNRKDFSSTMLMCAISRLLPGEPMLNMSEQKETNCATYMIIETASQLYFVQKIAYDADGSDSSYELQEVAVSSSTQNIAKQFRDCWSRRPFQYSGAINLDVAFVIIDILRDILSKDGTRNARIIRILDPTCGSGTFLSLALMALGTQMDVQAVGIDSNDKCAEGTVRNLGHMYENAVVCKDDENDNSWTLTFDTANNTTSRATIYAEDSVQLGTFISQKFDCAVANLPWNRNTFEYEGDDSTRACTNSDILEAVYTVLKPGSPLVVVSGSDGNESGHETTSFSARDCLENLGFSIVGEATIPPKGFALPTSSKKGGIRDNQKRVQRSSDCIITVVVSPQ